MIDNLVFSYNKSVPPEVTKLETTETTSLSLGIDTYSGDYNVDYGDGNIFHRVTSNELLYELRETGNNVEIFTDKENIKGITISNENFSFSSDVFHGMNKLKKIDINSSISMKINQIPQSVNFIKIGGENCEIVNGYSGYNFLENMIFFELKNQSGTPLSSGQVDNLLGDLAELNWIGSKVVNILGINEGRTSSSDSDVSTLQDKGVIVNTN